MCGYCEDEQLSDRNSETQRRARKVGLAIGIAHKIAVVGRHRA